LLHQEERTKHMQSLATAHERKREAAQNSVREGLSRAVKSGDDKRLKNMAAKQRKIERIGIEKNAKGHRFKISRDRRGYHDSVRDQTIVEPVEAPAIWTFPIPSVRRHRGPLFVADGVSLGYNAKSPPILKDVTFTVSPQTCVGIVGNNGEGKTTLMKFLSGGLAAFSGVYEMHSSARFGCISQQQVEDYFAYPVEVCAVSLLLTERPGSTESEARAHLGKFGIKGNTAIQSLSSLSGGQMMRVAFSLETFKTFPHLLILEEPTNHLDMLTIQSLIKSLQEYSGALFVSSHDRYFLSQVASDFYLVSKGKVKYLTGGLQDYLNLLKKQRKKLH
jgi:ATP-binding cassette, subfamily F, member 3